MREHLRRFLHSHGWHRLCVNAFVADEWGRRGKEFIKDDDGNLIDVTTHGGAIKRYHWEHQ